VCALWPARMASRRSLGQALAQRNALLIRIRAGQASSESLGAWDTEVGRHGIAVMDDRRSAVALLAPRFGEIADSLGLDGGPELVYRPRSLATTAQELTAEITARRATLARDASCGRMALRGSSALGFWPSYWLNARR